MKIKLLIVITLIISCTPQKRFERLTRKHPELLKDSVILKIDTIVKNGIGFDTVYISKPIDSIVIDTGGINVKVYRIYDTLKVKLKSRQDTIFVKNKETVRYIHPAKQSNYIMYILIGALLTLFLILLLKK